MNRTLAFHQFNDIAQFTFSALRYQAPDHALVGSVDDITAASPITIPALQNNATQLSKFRWEGPINNHGIGFIRYNHLDQDNQYLSQLYSYDTRQSPIKTTLSTFDKIFDEFPRATIRDINDKGQAIVVLSAVDYQDQSSVVVTPHLDSAGTFHWCDPQYSCKMTRHSDKTAQSELGHAREIFSGHNRPEAIAINDAGVVVGETRQTRGHVLTKSILVHPNNEPEFVLITRASNNLNVIDITNDGTIFVNDNGQILAYIETNPNQIGSQRYTTVSVAKNAVGLQATNNGEIIGWRASDDETMLLWTKDQSNNWMESNFNDIVPESIRRGNAIKTLKSINNCGEIAITDTEQNHLLLAPTRQNSLPIGDIHAWPMDNMDDDSKTRTFLLKGYLRRCYRSSPSPGRWHIKDVGLEKNLDPEKIEELDNGDVIIKLGQEQTVQATYTENRAEPIALEMTVNPRYNQHLPFAANNTTISDTSPTTNSTFLYLPFISQ